MAITFRAVKGSNLTATEVDENFQTLLDSVNDILENPPEAVSIDHFTIEGTLLTIVMTDASEHGPFVLPMAQWRFVGEWSVSTQYFLGDIFTESGNVYFVAIQHISDDTTFDPDLFTVDGQVYQLIMPRQTFLFSIYFYERDLVGEGEDIIWQYVADRDFSIETGFEGSKAYLRVATSENAISLPVYQNGTVIGMIVFVPGVTTDVQGGQYGTFDAVDDVDIEVAAGDIIAFGQPYDADIAAAGLTVSIKATIEGVS